MTGRQKKFVEYYVRDCNGTKAARLAGYHGDDNALAVRASELVRNSKIASAIEARHKSLHLSSEKIIGRLAEMATTDADEFLDEHGALDIAKLRARGYLVKRLKTRTTFEGDDAKPTRVVFVDCEFHDAQAALGMLAKNKNLLGSDLTVVINFKQNFFAALTEGMRLHVAEDQRAPLAQYLREHCRS